MKNKIYWQTTVEMPSAENLAPIPPKADVIIIGGGYTGLSAARTLAKDNANVVVLEAETIGWGASSRNGGMTLTGLKESMQTVVKRHGLELAKELFQASLDAVNLVEQIVAEENIDCGFARYGHLFTANKPKHYVSLQKEAEFLAKKFNHPTTMIPAKDLRGEIGSDIYHGALLDEISGGLNPARYVAGLAGAAARAGAKLCARARVNQIERREGRFVIRTERGNAEAQSVLIATSGYTGGITNSLRRRIFPVGSYVIATEKLSVELARELSPRNRMIFDYKNFLNYFRLWDNRLIFGGRPTFFPESEKTLAQNGETLRREMVEVYPQLKDAKVEYVWSGAIDFALDQMPHVGEEDGIFFALGYAGHGVALATYLGASVGAAMLKGGVKENPFARYDFAPVPLYNGTPWFLPLAGAWYRILDWAG
ncbi:MAG: FAD-binding oxidoreductase [Anaerolineales bacterium]|nr:FAD-binding oxidoreductase [Anaerolineales bacterium]